MHDGGRGATARGEQVEDWLAELERAVYEATAAWVEAAAPVTAAEFIPATIREATPGWRRPRTARLAAR